MTEDLADLMCPHSAAGRPERFPAKACILAGECGCVYGAEWSRALGLADEAGACVEAYRMAWSRTTRLADDAAESVICTEGHSPAAYHWVLTHEQIAADPHLEDCIAHLEWRGIARRFDAEDGVTVIFEEQP